MRRIAVVALSVLVLTLGVTLRASDKARELELQQAIDLIESKGDLAKATVLLEDVAKSSDRALAARGLFQLAQAQERFGKKEAVTTYQRLVAEFGGPAEPAAATAVVAAARTKLEAIGQKGAGLTARRVWDSEGDGISPDGRYIMFTDWNTGDLAIHELPAGQEKRLTRNGKWNDDFAEGGLPSPDGRLVAYQWFEMANNHRTLRVISRDGGQARVVYANADNADTAWPVGWSSDGKWILATVDKDLPAVPRTLRLRNRDLVLISTTGAPPRIVKHFENQPWNFGIFEMNPRLSPDGRSIAYNVVPAPGKRERDVNLLSVDTGQDTPLIHHPADDDVLGWLPSGDRMLFCSDRAGTYGIWAVRVVDGRVVGEPEPVRLGTGLVFSNGVTRQGDFYYSIRNRDADVYVANLETASGGASTHPVRFESRFVGGKLQAAWSPDGSRLVYVKEYTPTETVPTLAVQEISTGATKSVTLALQNVNNPVWLPNGRAVIVQGRDLQGRQGIHRVDLETGTMTSIAVREPGNDVRRGSAAPSPDGRRVFLAWSSPTDPAVGGIAARDLISGEEQRLTNLPVVKLVISPDGRWLAATPMDAEHQPHLLVIPSTGGAGNAVASAVAAWKVDDITWSADSKAVLVVKAGQRTQEVWRVPIDGGEPRNTGISMPMGIQRISAHPDGRRLALSASGSSAETWVLQNLPTTKDK